MVLLSNTCASASAWKRSPCTKHLDTAFSLLWLCCSRCMRSVLVALCIFHKAAMGNWPL